MKEDATARRQQLGRLLRRAREAAGLTQSQVAKRLGCGQAKINKIETKLVRIDQPDLEKLLELYNPSPDQAAELRELAELDQQEGPARTKYSNSLAAFNELSELEPEASEIWCWHSERIPGPLQSEMYNLRQQEPKLKENPTAVTQMLREWTARTKLFTVPKPPRYRVILSESSLLRLPGGRTTDMMVDQCEHLLTLMNTYEQLELQILTFDADVRYVDSDFQLLKFDNPKHCDFVYIEYPGGSRKCKSSDVLAECRKHWATLSAAALDLAASREFLNRRGRRDEPSAH